MERVSTRRVDDCEVLAFVRARRDEALFAVVMTIVLKYVHRTVEYQSDPLEVDASGPKDRMPLRFVPSEPHGVCTSSWR
jgi:hypothetical protein